MGAGTKTLADLRRLALTATHDRSRERFLALHGVAPGARATKVAARMGRHPQTVMGWLHGYNGHGPEALLYRRTGGRTPFVPASRQPLAKTSAPRSNRSPAHP